MKFEIIGKKRHPTIYNSRNLLMKFELTDCTTKIKIYNSRNLLMKFEFTNPQNPFTSTTVEIY